MPNYLFADELKNLSLIIVSLIFAVIFLKAGSFLIRKHFNGRKDKAQVKEMASIYYYSLVIVVILVLVVVFSNIFKNVLASVGIFVAGLAIALQKPILNIFGWFAIVLKRPYVIGDRVCIGANKGDVYEINIMHTSMSEIQDDVTTGKMLAVPNEFVLTQPIINYTKGTPYVWDAVSVVFEKGSDEKKAERLLLDATEKIVGKLMHGLSKKWTEIDGRKVDVKPEVTIEIIVVNGISAVQLTSRYLCNVYEKKAVRSRISSLLIQSIKRTRGVRLK